MEERREKKIRVFKICTKNQGFQKIPRTSEFSEKKLLSFKKLLLRLRVFKNKRN